MNDTGFIQELGLPSALLPRLNELAENSASLDRSLADPEILADHTKVRDLSIKKAALEPIVLGWNRVKHLAAEIDELRGSIQSGDDPELAELARAEIPSLEEEARTLIDDVKGKLVTSEDRRVGSVIVELRAGAGGDEAGLWCRDLLQMYEKYAQSKAWGFEPMELTADAEVGGIRHAVVNVKGEGVFAELGFESGVHSVKRVPATETQGRVHTSTATVAVLPEPEEVEVNIDWANDVEEHITTAQGPGGQNVNKVATAVLMRHTPTGIEVRMQETKSQQQNREKARRLLKARVYEIERAKAEAERSAERRSQIGTGERSEKIRVYRFQDGIVADQRLSEKFQVRDILAGDLAELMHALIEQETARRLANL